MQLQWSHWKGLQSVCGLFSLFQVKKLITWRKQGLFYSLFLQSTLKRLCWAMTAHTLRVWDEDKNSLRFCINLLFTEQQSLFSSTKASRSSDIAGTAYKCWNSHSTKAINKLFLHAYRLFLLLLSYVFSTHHLASNSEYCECELWMWTQVNLWMINFYERK